MLQCQKCRSREVHRSRARSVWEAWRKKLTSKRPYRCTICGWREWLPDQGPQFDADMRERAERAVVSDSSTVDPFRLKEGAEDPQSVSQSQNRSRIRK